MTGQQIGSAAPPATAEAAVARFARLCDDQIPRIHAFVARRVADRATVEEITTAVFERGRSVVAAAAPDPEALVAFLYRVAATAVVDHARRERGGLPRGARASDFDHPGDRERAQEVGDERATRAFGGSLDRERLRRAVLGLPAEQQRLVILRYFDGLAPQELAAVLGCEPDALAVQTHRALRELRRFMDGEAAGAA